jgi:epoxyqueuosine reductase
MAAVPKTGADTLWIAEAARSLGFDLCGVAPANDFPELRQLNDWLERGYAGEMNYLYDPRRANLQAAMTGVESVIVCAINYNAPQPYSTEAAAIEPGEEKSPRGWISRYAWGSDYHEVLSSKLNALVVEMRKKFPEPFEARASADTGPVQERVLAKHAGLGWIGKNTLLLNQQIGSWLFLGTILTDLELMPTVEPNKLPQDLCGTCTRCIEACPTDALIDPYVMDARRCIAYLTIELRGPIPTEFREPMGNHVFGCDICQDVCPWNRKSPRTVAREFQPRKSESTNESLFHPQLEWLASLDEQEYRRAFRVRAMKHAK